MSEDMLFFKWLGIVMMLFMCVCLIGAFGDKLIEFHETSSAMSHGYIQKIENGRKLWVKPEVKPDEGPGR